MRPSRPVIEMPATSSPVKAAKPVPPSAVARRCPNWSSGRLVAVCSPSRARLISPDVASSAAETAPPISAITRPGASTPQVLIRSQEIALSTASGIAAAVVSRAWARAAPWWCW